MNKNIDLGLLILRLSVGALMLFHGVAKLMNGIAGIQGLLKSIGLPEFLAYGVYVGEIIMPLLLIIGFRTRISAVFIAITMLFVLFIAHGGDIFTLADHGGWAVELVGLYLFGAIALFFTGGGKYAVSSSNKWD